MEPNKTQNFGTEIARAFKSAGLEKDFDNPTIKDSVQTLEGSALVTPMVKLAAKKQILGYVEAGMEENRDTPVYFKYADLRTRIENILMGAK